jgi:putative ABC transport system ATP-binding protein
LILSLNKISKTYRQPGGDVKVLSGVDFELPEASSAALVGESGSGKSTLLHIISGLDQPDSGEIHFCGDLISEFDNGGWNLLRRTRLSLIFQQFHLIPTLNVMDNIQLQARLAGGVDLALRDHLIDRLGLSNLGSRLPHQLSGGQQQRVAIARALLHRPKLVLADEPTGNLDEATSKTVIQLLLELSQETQSGLVIVTHSREMASYMDSCWLLQDSKLHQLPASSSA